MPLFLMILLLSIRGFAYGQEKLDTLVLDDLMGEDQFVVAVHLCAATPNAETVKVWLEKPPNGIGRGRPQTVVLAPNPRDNVLNAVRLWEAYLTNRDASQRHQDQAQRYLRQANMALSAQDVKAFLTSLPYRQLIFLRSDTLPRGEIWYMSLTELQRLLPGWEPKHLSEIDYGNIYSGIDYSPLRRPEEQVEIFWMTLSLTPRNNLSATFVETIRSALDQSIAEHPQRSSEGSKTYLFGLVCIGITLVFYALEWFLAWKFLLPMWKAGIDPIERYLTRVGKGHSARKAAAQKEMELASVLKEVELKRQWPAHLADFEKMPLTDNSAEMGRLSGPDFLNSQTSRPQGGVCFFCERAPGHWESAYYAQKKVGLPKKVGERKVGNKLSGGYTISTFTQEVRSKTFPRCQECCKVHERTAFELAWGLVGGFTLFVLLFPIVLTLCVIWFRETLGIVLAVLAVGSFIIAPLVALLRGGIELQRKRIKGTHEAKSIL